jgi:hypothetical protein
VARAKRFGVVVQIPSKVVLASAVAEDPALLAGFSNTGYKE